MNKQTKQLIALAALVIVGGIVAAWRLGAFGGDEEKAAPPTDPNATAQTPTPVNPGGEPGPATPTDPNAQPGQPGAAPQVQDQDLEIPEEVNIPLMRTRWRWENGGMIPQEDPKADPKTFPYDPLWVQNIDVVDPKRKEYIDKLKEDWVLDGITKTFQRITKEGENGEKVEVEEGVLEAWFKGKPRPYGEKDRLTNTRFTIDKIFENRVYRQEGSSDFKVRSGVDLIGDTGAKLTIFVADDARYTEIRQK